MLEFSFVSTYEMFFLFVVFAICVGNLLAMAIYGFLNYMFGGWALRGDKLSPSRCQSLAYVPDINVGDIENTRVLDYSESKEASE